MPTSKSATHPSRILLLAGDSKNSALAEMAGSTHHLAYSPYGQQSSSREVMTHLGFNGELREAKTDWYFLGKGYRVYNPRLMRFHSPDKFSPFAKGGINGYAYCGCEPVMRADPSGEGWLFNRFADFWGLVSPVGTGGNAGRTVRVPKPTRSDGMVDIMVGMERNQRTSFRNTSKTTLGKSKPQKGLPTGPTPSPATNTAAQPSASAVLTKRNDTGTKFVLEKNYGVRPQNEHSTVKTRDGSRISSTDSGTRQFPSSSRGNSSAMLSKIRHG